MLTSPPQQDPRPAVVYDPALSLRDEGKVRTRRLEEVPEVCGISHRAALPRETLQPCPICHERVFDLRYHADSCHLPWILDRETACGICQIQLNRPRRRDAHASANHPGLSRYVLVKEWVRDLHTMFDMIAESLHLSLSELPQYARRMDYNLRKVY